MGVMSWLAARFSRSQMLAPISAVDPPALYFQHTRIGGGLTPDDVSQILREVDTGYLYRFIDLFNESRQKDCQLQSVCATREMGVSSMRWELTDASDSPEDKKIGDFCRDWLQNFGTSPALDDEEEPKDLRHLVSHLTAANLHAFSFAETLFAKDGGYVVPTGAVPIAHRRFVYELQRGKLQFWDMFGDTPYPGIDLMSEYPGRFVLYQPRVNGDVPYREGLSRVLVWAALFRSWSIGDWMKLAEIAWKPWRIGTYKKGADKKDVSALINAMQRLTTDGVAWLPETTAIEIAWAKKTGASGGGTHDGMANFLGAEMSKAVLGATLTVEQGKVGSHALGEIHNEVRHDIRDADAAGIASALRRTLIAPTVRMNFGKGAAIPGFAFHTDKQVDLVQLSLAVVNLVNAGLAIPADWARGLAGIPTPKAGEELIGGGAVTPEQLDAIRRLMAEAGKRGLLPTPNDNEGRSAVA